jgi:hypothetical protein
MCDENGTMMLGYYLECHVSRDTPKKVIWHVLRAGSAGIAIQKESKNNVAAGAIRVQSLMLSF